MKINKTFIHTIKGIAIGLVLVAGISYVQAAWAPPAGAPSEANNAPAPINVSSSNQAKEGWLSLGTTANPNVQLEITTPVTDNGTTWTDILQVWKTSQFVGSSKFGKDGQAGVINIVEPSAKVNIGYDTTAFVTPTGPEELNVSGDILSTALVNAGPGFDITLKGQSDDWYPTMLCADTNGKIVLCKDIDVPDVEVEDIPLSVSYTQSGLISEDSCTKSYTYTASATGADGSVFYEWRYSGYAADWTYYGSGSPITISFPKKVGSTYVTQVRLTGSSGDETNTAEALYSPITIPARPAGASC
ncbi:MAG: hypothetical protein KBF62_01950 [Candidatus Pacebacteria bacterium]|nr:hypothetical protein [Candidatus Paceibacterota bacterium]MBP9058382.1 hypothetical protein [Candidatus Paceibacterota bacterium]MBP9770254.1 hypothetical protein [Candidatus Paceibacterota bacterium]